MAAGGIGTYPVYHNSESDQQRGSAVASGLAVVSGDGRQADELDGDDSQCVRGELSGDLSEPNRGSDTVSTEDADVRTQGTGGEDDDSPVGTSGIPEEKSGSRRDGTHLILAIGETEYKFALLGFSIGLKATPEVRRVRKEAFDAAVVAVAELPVEVSK